MRATTQQLRDTIWAISKESIRLNDFVIRIKNYIAKQIEHDQNLSLSVHFNDQDHCLELSSTVALNLFRVLQEAVNNIQKHSQASQITILFKIENDIFEVEITDNGKGFDPTILKNESYGIENMKSRIEQLNGNFEINSRPNEGTKIKISNIEIRQSTY